MQKKNEKSEKVQATNLKKIMVEKGVESVEVAFKTNISYETIQAIKNGKQDNPKLKTAYKIAHFWGLTVDEVFHDLMSN